MTPIAIILTLVLLYVSIGLILVLRYMRGFTVRASLGEWLGLILFWPLVLPLYRLMTTMSLFEEGLKEWAEREEQDDDRN